MSVVDVETSHFSVFRFRKVQYQTSCFVFWGPLVWISFIEVNNVPVLSGFPGRGVQPNHTLNFLPLFRHTYPIESLCCP